MCNERAPIERQAAGEVARVVNHWRMRRTLDVVESFHFWQVRIFDEASTAIVSSLLSTLPSGDMLNT